MNFLYEALDASGHTVMGKIEAHNEAEVLARLNAMGYRAQTVAAAGGSGTAAPGQQLSGGAMQLDRTMLSGGGVMTAAPRPSAPMAREELGDAVERRRPQITLSGSAAQLRVPPAAARPAAAPLAPAASTLDGVSTRDLMFFFRQLSTLVHSGISIYQACETVAGRTNNRNLALVCREMATAARNGGAISEVMSRYPRIFPHHVAAAVRAGETGGFLEISLSELAQNYEENIALYRTAWIPKAMAVQALFMVPFVQPLFSSLYNSMDFAANARLYLELVFFRNLPITIGFYFGVKAVARWLQRPERRRWLDAMALKMPPFGDLQRQSAVASFIRMLRRLYHAGVAPIAAWEGAMHTAANSVVREKLISAHELVRTGSSIPDAFYATGLFASPVEQLIATGHDSGQVVESLDQAADYYQNLISESAGKSRFMIFRLGLLAMIILGGACVIWMVHTYFQGMFDFVDKNFGS